MVKTFYAISETQIPNVADLKLSTTGKAVAAKSISLTAMSTGKAVCISMDALYRSGLYRFSEKGSVFYVEAHPDADLDDCDYGFPPAILERLPPRPPHCNWVDLARDCVKWTTVNLPWYRTMLASKQNRFT
jgi:hypothetical protein